MGNKYIINVFNINCGNSELVIIIVVVFSRR